MLNVCVVLPIRTRVTFAMLAAFGVCTVKTWPVVSCVGVEVMTGRGPLKRYGGLYTSAESWSVGSKRPNPRPLPETSTRASGSRMAVWWYMRGAVIEAIVVHVWVVGDQS